MDTKKSGKLGGNKTLEKYGKKHFSKISKDAWIERKRILKAFRLYELDNPITKASITEKLEQLDN